MNPMKDAIKNKKKAHGVEIHIILTKPGAMPGEATNNIEAGVSPEQAKLEQEGRTDLAPELEHNPFQSDDQSPPMQSGEDMVNEKPKSLGHRVMMHAKNKHKK